MGSFRRAFEIQKATRRENFDGVEVGGQKLRFGKKTEGLIVRDEAKAREIHQRYGYGSNALGKGGTGEVVVMAVDDHPVEPGHGYTFVFQGVPWARYDELGRRIRDGEEDGQNT